MPKMDFDVITYRTASIKDKHCPGKKRKIKVALAHPAASNGVCPRQRSGCNGY
jgi:hypothetical protein